MGLLDFIVHTNISFAAYLKHSSLWPSDDVEHMQTDIAHAAPQQCMFTLSMCIVRSLWYSALLSSYWPY